MGRQLILDAEAVAKMIQLARDNVPRLIIAHSVGVSERCLYQWLAKGRSGDGTNDGLFVQLFQGLKKARAEAVAEGVARIRMAGAGGAVLERKTVKTTKPNGEVVETVSEKIQAPQWTADAWLLERLEPDSFASNSREIRELQKNVKVIEERLLKLRAQAPEFSTN